MKDSEIKSKIARIVMGAVKSTLKDHPEFLDGRHIRKSSISSIAKRSAGHILRLLRMHAVTNEVLKDADDPFSKALAYNLKKRQDEATGEDHTLELHSSLFDESYPGVEPFEEQMIEDMKTDVPEELERRSTLNNKPRC